jgi:hypothetical protein
VRNGYNSVCLSKGNKKKTYNVHTLVAEHFLDKPPIRNYVVNHKDENKLNNNLSNLEYITYRDNTLYSCSSKRSKNQKEFDINKFLNIPGCGNYMVSKCGDIYSKKMRRLCCTTILPNGYHKLKLLKDNGVYKDYYVHVLVAMTYLSHTPGTGFVVNHKDGIKGNNKLDNLEVITQKENMIHSVKMNSECIFRRGVYYINETGQEIRFKSAKEACLATGIDNSSILKSCKANRKAGNLKWYFTSNS